MPRLAILLLAAGRSRRFGGDKLLAQLPDGRYLIDHSLSVYLQASQQLQLPMYVAIYQNNVALIEYVSEFFRLHGCAHSCHIIPIVGEERGLGLSISQAVSVLHRQSAFDGWLFGLADMPCIKAETIISIVRSFNGTGIIQSRYLAADGLAVNGREKSGHPVLFSAAFTAELSLLAEDRGAKVIIDRHQDSVIPFYTDDQGILFDIDTADDLVLLTG